MVLMCYVTEAFSLVHVVQQAALERLKKKKDNTALTLKKYQA